MLQLGDYTFSLATAGLASLRRRHAWRWGKVDRVGRAPARQYVGPGEATLSLEGSVFPHFRGGLGQVARMREEAGRGEPLQLVDEAGFVYGRHVVLSAAETRTHLDATGTPWRIDFALELAEYGEDGP